MSAKEDHQKRLNEVEKCYAVITCQFGTIKGAHERLEQSGKYKCGAWIQLGKCS